MKPVTVRTLFFWLSVYALQAISPSFSRPMANLPVGLRRALVHAVEAAGRGRGIDAGSCATLGRSPPGSVWSGCFTPASARFRVGPTRLRLRLVAWGRPGHLHAARLSIVRTRPDRLVYRGPGIREWWRVQPRGFEQGFTLKNPSLQSGRLELELSANPTPVRRKGALCWGELCYGQIQAQDARGRPLPVRMQVLGRSIRLFVHTRHETGPITIDPLVWLEDQVVSLGTGFLDTPSLALSANGTTALVGAPSAGTGGEVYVLAFSNGSWSLVNVLSDPGNTTNDGFGSSVALSANGSLALIGEPGLLGRLVTPPRRLLRLHLFGTHRGMAGCLTHGGYRMSVSYDRDDEPVQ